MRKKLTLKNLNLSSKKALIRVDFNVPLNHGQMTDDMRIRASLPTIQYVLKQGGSVILMSHLGRPKGKPVAEFSLAPCAERLAALLQQPVQMAPDCIGPEVEKMVDQLQPGQVLLLENLRFHSAEEKPEEDPRFTSALAQLGDVYINDAFGSAHRSHASTTQIASFFPGQAAMGFLMEKEIEYLGSVLTNPQRPFYAILGGAKISTKFKVIEALMKQADALLIGGAMAYTFFKAQGIEMGDSLVENDFIMTAQQLLHPATQSHCQLILPLDIVITRAIDSQADTHVVESQQGIPLNFQGVDIGPKTIKKYQEELQKARTVFWNGPLGVFEQKPFDQGTTAIAHTLAKLSATTIVGGGDSIAAIEQAGESAHISHLSTGGGASLEFIEQGQLPGIEALSNY
jgi:3-phosphoglycerate kinase